MKKKMGNKLFRLRKNGTLGPLFIDRKKIIEVGVEYPFEEHLTKGFAFRPGWHICSKKEAPHLSMKGRVWAKVEFTPMAKITRPENQGGVWFLGSTMKIIKVYQ